MNEAALLFTFHLKAAPRPSSDLNQLKPVLEVIKHKLQWFVSVVMATG